MIKASNHTEQDHSSSSSSSTTELSSYTIFSFTFLMIETVIGTLVNGYIVIVNLIDLVTQRKLGSGDIILTCLGLSRFGFQYLVLVLYMLFYWSTNLVISESSITDLQYVWLFFHNISAWLAAFLCAFYCVRIVNIQQRIFVFLKTYFDKCVPYFMLASAGISALCSNPIAYEGLNNVFNMSKFDHDNRTSQSILGGKNVATFSTISVVGIIPSFLLFCISSGLVVGSLLRHTSKVKGQERTGFREPSLKAHYRAVMMMGAFFVFFFLYTLSFNLYVCEVVDTDLGVGICNMIIGAYPSLHSLVLANGNPKLKQTFMKILQRGHCYQAEMTQIETIDS